MGSALQGQRVLVIGRGSRIARAVALEARSEGATVIVAGRDRNLLASAYDDDNISAATVDVTEDRSIEALAESIGTIDHLVSTVSARARGRLAELDRTDLQLSFDTKVIGPVMLAKHFASRIAPTGSIVLFSGVNAFKVSVGYLGVAITNGAVDFLTRSLALELAPIRVNAISPGVIDTGAWDSLGSEEKERFFRHIESVNPAGRIGTVEDIAHAVLYAMTNTFVTGTMLRVDGGEPLT